MVALKQNLNLFKYNISKTKPDNATAKHPFRLAKSRFNFSKRYFVIWKNRHTFASLNNGHMKEFIDCLFSGKTAVIAGLTLAMVGVIAIIRRNIKAKKASDKAKEASNKTDVALEQQKALLRAQFVDIASANKPFDELTSQEVQTIWAFDQHNINPQTEEEWFVKGYTALGIRNYDEAIRCYKEAIELNPNNAIAYYNLGVAYSLGLQYYDEAIKCYNKAIELNLNDADLYYNLGFAYSVGMEDYDAAIECYNKAIELNFNDADAYFDLGDAYLEGNQDYDNAIKYYKKAIELNPNYADAYNNLGNVYIELGNEEEAIKYFKEAADLGDELSKQWLHRNNIAW